MERAEEEEKEEEDSEIFLSYSRAYLFHMQHFMVIVSEKIMCLVESCYAIGSRRVVTYNKVASTTWLAFLNHIL